MAEIALTKGMVALVDDEDYEWLSQWKWYLHSSGGGRYYAARNARLEDAVERRGLIYMHRQIAGADGDDMDHANGESLDNRRANLRPASRGQNMANARLRANNLTGFRGVGFDCRKGRYRARVHYSGKESHLGYFDCPAEAARAYDMAALNLYGEFARLNFPMESH